MPKRHDTNEGRAVRDADAFFDVVESARIRGGGTTSRSLRAGQPLSFPQSSACFHFIENAACRLRMTSGRQELRLQPGDLVVLPQGGSHALESVGDGDAGPRITTCDFRFEGPGGTLLANALPSLLHVSDAAAPPAAFPDTPREWLSVTLAAIRRETDRPWLGSSVMLSRLVDLLFVWSLRHWLVTASPQAGSLARALDDAVVGRALALLHAQPAKDWSVEALARALNQSRSGLSQRFVETLGEPPMRYLTRWRMQLAADMLASTRLRVSQIAQRVGYESEPAFSRAFRRQFGTAPVDYRRQSKPETQ
ncbi:AraC family transcriptional regulator [Pseudoluteimonas lycopersici]|uniref:AraC family transcriptional regulator n=1 Tax=Pseudoluteimonas lycopersici TaxID=1324796 RepID=A0A516V1Q7_9GAMM|nr:AraC family transcriptional regulator [Lysobacter lycopersici]QDQ72453.1 AraC family transcriptional regulator [Lysobacter lycopersici]